MENNERKTGKIKNIIKRIYKIIMVIVFLYFGSLAIMDLVILPIVTGTSPQFFGFTYYFSENKILDKKNKSDWKDSIEIVDEIIFVSISNLAKAYETNALEANKIFQGNVLRLTGNIHAILEKYSSDEDESTYYLRLEEKSKHYSFDWVYVYLKEDEMYKIENLVIGQKITIVGEFTAEIGVMIIKNTFIE